MRRWIQCYFCGGAFVWIAEIANMESKRLPLEALENERGDLLYKREKVPACVTCGAPGLPLNGYPMLNGEPWLIPEPRWTGNTSEIVAVQNAEGRGFCGPLGPRDYPHINIEVCCWKHQPTSERHDLQDPSNCWCQPMPERTEGGVKVWHNDGIGKKLGLAPDQEVGQPWFIEKMEKRSYAQSRHTDAILGKDFYDDDFLGKALNE